MTQQTINIGSAELQGDGESIRSAFNKVNSNFTEIYSISHTGNISFTGTVMYSSSGLTISNQGTSTGATAVITLPSDAGYNLSLLNNYGVISLTAAADPGSQKTWTFTTSGSLTAPGHIIPTENLSYDLGSTSSQWRSLYVGTGTIYIGGVPITVNTSNNTLIVGASSGESTTATNLATESYVIDYVTQHGGGNQAVTTTSTLINGTYTVSLSNVGLTQFPTYGEGSLFIQGPEIGSVNSSIAVSVANDIILTSNILVSPKQWTFGTGSNITLPGGGNIIGADYSIAIVGGNDGSSAYGDVNITTNNPFSTSTWSFGTMGELTLPSGGEITSNQITNEVFGTTTTSLTLVPGGATESGQRLEIYATIGGEGNHLHLTAGELPTELYLGNDSQYVKLASDGHIEISSQGGLRLWGQGIFSNAYIYMPTQEESTTTSLLVANYGDAGVLIQAGQGDPETGVPPSWTFGADGTLEFPDGSTQTTAHESTSGSWTLSPGANTVSFTVDPNATYTMWVNGNIPNGIVKWNATISLSNPNVPALGCQYGWYYDAGNQLVLTSIPDQIVGTNGSISTATVVTTASNVLTFGITNNSGSSQVVNWGYTKI